jgi:hypothetical protein
MNPNNDPNISNHVNEQPSKTPGNDSNSLIDAEIIAEIRTNHSQIDEKGENPINLTYCPSIEEEYNQETKDWLKQALIPLSTPWGLGSLSLILGANLAMGGVQLWRVYQTPTEELSASITPDTVSNNLYIPKSLNIARQSPNTVIVNALSTVPSPSTPQQSPQKKATASTLPQPPTPNVVNVNQPLSLKNAILPPSLQPQPLPNYGMSSTPLKVPQAPQTTPPPPPPIPIANIPRPVTPSVKPPTFPPVPMETPTPPVNNEMLSKDEQVRQAVKQQLKIEENNNSDIPLGFNHNTRLQLQNGLNKMPSELLPQQVNTLEQLQQREVLDSVK